MGQILTSFIGDKRKEPPLVAEEERSEEPALKRRRVLVDSDDKEKEVNKDEEDSSGGGKAISGVPEQENKEKPSTTAPTKDEGDNKDQAIAVGRDDTAVSGNSSATSDEQKEDEEADSEELELFAPTQEELDSCKTNQQRDWLKVWYEKVNVLAKYEKEFGNCNVPQKGNPDVQERYPRLGRFVCQMRQQKKYLDEGGWKGKTTLTPRKLEILESLDFNWGKRRT